MYKSPIEIIQGQLQMQMEDNIMKAVQSVHVNVDKEELLRALQYDRQQYNKGYADALAYARGELNLLHEAVTESLHMVKDLSENASKCAERENEPMKKHCGNCANHSNKTNQFSKECGKCVAAVLENGERTDPSHWREKPKTNADRIRAMSDEELADMCVRYDPERDMYTTDTGGAYYDFVAAMEDELEWLQQPAKGE